MRLVFLGPPGAGKGTQAERLCRDMNWAHVSTGDLLREAVAEASELGLKAVEFMKSGRLVPDDLVVSLVAERLKRDDCTEGFVLDGFPRTVVQAEMLEETLDTLDIRLDRVLYFATDREVIITRLSGRRICRDCGANYHVTNIPPKVEGVCDRCGGELYQRDDDRPETVQKRLVVYEEQTAPLIRFYEERGLLKELSGNLEVEEGQAAIRTALGVPAEREP
ncbi:MAG TPA: adenylate kinase [Planctomycetota bacterium]|nr:adenylate kinase [Planctomycetota bacterium]